MTPASMERIQASFDQISRRFDCVAAGFYERLFADDPTTRHLFKSDLTVQAAHLAAGFALIVRNLCMLDALEQPLMELGIAHGLIGVRPAHYPVACRSFLGALEDVLGDGWTSELAADWERLLSVVTGHMATGNRAVNDVAAPPPRDRRD